MNPPDVDTWYVLVDGTKAHPADVSTDDAGILKHANGVPVALRDNGLPLTTGDANRENAMAADLGKEAEEKAKADSKAKADAEAAKKPGKADKPTKAKPGDTPAEADRQLQAGDGAKTYETR